MCLVAESVADRQLTTGRMRFRVYGARWDGGRYRCTAKHPEATDQMMGPGYYTCRHRDRKYRATVKFSVYS
jgi:hypothetical protein